MKNKKQKKIDNNGGSFFYGVFKLIMKKKKNLSEGFFFVFRAKTQENLQEFMLRYTQIDLNVHNFVWYFIHVLFFGSQH